MTYIISLTYIFTGMLTKLPYYRFKSYFANTKLNLIIIYQHAVALKHFKGRTQPVCIFTILHYNVTVIYVTLNV